MYRTKQEKAFRNFQSQKDKVSLENLPHFYQTESELYKKAVESVNLLEQENPVMVRNSQRQKLIESRSRCFKELTNKKVDFGSVIIRLANLTKAIYGN